MEEEDYLQTGAVIGEELSLSSPDGRASLMSKMYRYELIEMLGTGKMAEVWRCKEVATGRQVAVKFQATGQSVDLSTECSALQRTKGQGVASVFYFNQASARLRVVPRQGGLERPLGGVEMMVLELLGDSLERIVSRIKGSARRAAVAIEVGIQLLAVLERVHGEEVLHNDLSLSNIMGAWSPLGPTPCLHQISHVCLIFANSSSS